MINRSFKLEEDLVYIKQKGNEFYYDQVKRNDFRRNISEFISLNPLDIRTEIDS